jgi:ubiquinone biosynthesis protein COQ4
MSAPSTAVLDRLAIRKPTRHRIQPLVALAALRRLLAEPDDTQKALDVSTALDGDYSESQLCSLAKTREGRRLLAERPSLLALLADDAALAALPEGSLGRAYRDHLRRYGLDPMKLIELSRASDPYPDRDAAQCWIVERENLIHDLSHALTGYGADGLGEAALLAFSIGQQYRPSRLLLTAGASLEVMRRFGVRRWLPYVWRAWRRGRRAANLSALPYEELLPLPLDAVRRAVGIDPPERAHPGGVLELRGEGDQAEMAVR